MFAYALISLLLLLATFLIGNLEDLFSPAELAEMGILLGNAACAEMDPGFEKASENGCTASPQSSPVPDQAPQSQGRRRVAPGAAALFLPLRRHQGLRRG